MNPADAIEYLPPGVETPALLFLLFHGAGGTPYDLSPVMDRLAAEYPQAALLSLPGPDPFDAVPGGGTGRQWFSLQGLHDFNRRWSREAFAAKRSRQVRRKVRNRARSGSYPSKKPRSIARAKNSWVRSSASAG